MTSSVTLRTATFRGPVHEISEPVAVFPGETEEFSRSEIVCFVAKESFKAPAKIGAVPGLKAVAASDDPVVAKGAKHLAEPELQSESQRQNCEIEL